MNIPTIKLANKIILEKYKSLSTEDAFAEFNRLLDIIYSIKAIETQYDILVKDYEKAKDELDKKLSDIRGKCRHEKMNHFYGDYSSSYSECEICGERV